MPKCCIATIAALGLFLGIGWAQSPPATRTDALGDPLPAGATARLGTRRLWHGPLPKDVLFLDNERLLSVASARSYALPSRIWDARTGKPTGWLDYRDHYVSRLVPSPDRTRAIVRRNSNTLHIVDLKTGKVTHKFRAESGGNVRDVCFSPDGKFFAMSGIRSCEIWDAGKVELVRRFERRAASMSWSPDGKVLAVAQAQVKGRVRVGKVTLLDPETGGELRSTKDTAKPAYNVVRYSPDGKRLAATLRGTDLIHILDADDLSVKQTLRGTSRLAVFGIQWNPAVPDQVASGGRFHNVHVWDASTGKVLWSHDDIAAYTTRLSYSPDGKRLAGAGREGMIYIWDARTGRPILDHRRHDSTICSLDLSADGSKAVTAGAGGEVFFWNLSEPQTPASALEVTYRPQGVFLAGRASRPLVVYSQVSQLDVISDSGKKMVSLPAAAVAAALSPDGQALDILDEAGVYRRLSPAGKILAEARLFTPGKFKHNMGWMSPDRTWWATAVGAGLHLAYLSGTQDEQVRAPEALRLELGAKTARFGFGYGRYQQVAFNYNGSLLALSAEGEVKIVETDSGRSVLSLDTDKELPTAIAFDPSAPRVVVGQGDGRILLFHLPTGERIHALAGHAMESLGANAGRKGRSNVVQDQPLAVSCLRFERDANVLVSGSADHTVLLWDTTLWPEARVEAPKEDPATLWEQLGASEAAKAYQARWKLIGLGDEAVAFLAGKLKPSAALSMAEVRALVKQLSSPRFAQRKQAQEKLESSASQATDVLKRLLKENLPAETAGRIRKIIESAGEVTTNSEASLQSWRAIRVLERIGTPRARALLLRLSRGSSGARQTQLARDAAGRLMPGR